MNVIAHQTIRVDFEAAGPLVPPDGPDELFPVFIVQEYLLTIDAPQHNMIDSTNALFPGFPWHFQLLSIPR